MKRILIDLMILCLLFVFSASCSDSKPVEISQFLQELPGVQIKKLETEAPYKEVFELKLLQSLDHYKIGCETFEQRIILYHIDPSKPVVIVTEGYSMGRNFCHELAPLLNANQLRVEHRYFGESKPDQMKWEYLNLKQAAADYNRIVTIFKKYYTGPWVSTGWSKGGQTAMTYRSYFPNDVKATVAYDAPLNFAVEEPRVDAFFQEVGSQECREKLWAFQRLALKKKKELLPMFEEYANEKKYTYSIGLEKGFEYCVLEYTFSFWQYHHIPCTDIPGETATPREIFDHLEKVVYLGSYADDAMNSPSMYQFCTEFGYYGYVREHLKDLLSDTHYPNCAYAPKDVSLAFNPQIMQDLYDWLQTKGNNMIYIYGDQDPWSAPYVKPSPQTNAVTVFLEGGNHFTFIDTLLPEQKKQVLSNLRKWLKE